LHSTNTEFFTHPTSSERTLKIVIKAFLADTTDIELESFLKEKGYDILNARQFGNFYIEFTRQILSGGLSAAIM
jgi:hypothetical protein